MPSEAFNQLTITEAVSQNFPAAVLGGHNERNEPTLFLDGAHLLEICRYLKHVQKFVRLAGITGVDWYPADPRFEVVYLLHSIEANARLRLKIRVPESNPEIESVTPVWRSANWYEREVFDMFGVRFRNHPDLSRILMPTDWEGFPLRKDYPVHGHKYSYQDE